MIARGDPVIGFVKADPLAGTPDRWWYRDGSLKHYFDPDLCK
jgi:hypothetical protein